MFRMVWLFLTYLLSTNLLTQVAMQYKMDCTRNLVKYICIFSVTCSTCRAAVM